MGMNRVLYRSMQADVGVVDMDGRMQVGAAGVVDAANSSTPGVVVAHGATGVYTFTIAEGAPPGRLTAVFQMEAASQLLVRITALAAGVITVLVEDTSGVDTDPADNDAIHYRFAYKNSSVLVP